MQLDGVTQAGATTLNLIGNNASFANNVLNISRMAWQDKVVLRYSNAASDKDLEQGSVGQLVWNSADVAMASDVAAKQDALTAGAGIFLSGATISSYTLRWNATSTPTIQTAIQELHWDNYAIAETVNVGTGKIELTIGHPTDMASQTWANTQFQPLLTGVSQSGTGLTLHTTVQGDMTIDAFSTGQGQAGVFFKYDSGTGSMMFANSSYWGWIPRGSQTFRMYGTSQTPALEIPAGTVDVSVLGALNVTGTKNFVIDHPNPTLVADEGKRWRLRHICIESDLPLLMYRIRVVMTSTTQAFAMPPSWFPYIVTEPWISATPHKHFGSAWAEVAADGHTFTLHSTTIGEWDCLITSVRNDDCGQMCANTPIEFQEVLPPSDSR